MSSSSTLISSDHEDASTDDSERSIKIIDPADFVTYEDYVDAYICSEDIKYLQVMWQVTSWLRKSFSIRGVNEYISNF